MLQLDKNQKDAVDKLKSGKILVGGVGSGKSLTALAFYFQKVCGGQMTPEYKPMSNPKELYIITTARKRDTFEWQKECTYFALDEEHVHIDSWNNIEKYTSVKNAFFIFDEQRVVGSGAWVKAFLKLTQNNEWILLTATPGDTWSDYIPVFIANGYYKNRTEFNSRHVIYKRIARYPVIDRYIEISRLVRLRDEVSVILHYIKPATSHDKEIIVDFDRGLYDLIYEEKWNPWEERPIKDASEYCYALRRVVNMTVDRCVEIAKLIEEHPKVIIFYNFNYERDILLMLGEVLNIPTTQWNGNKHEEIPETDSWIYIVQYAAGAEGWNCIETDTMIFYSQNYSYKATIQAAGRIDRRNTPFTDLYFYYLRSESSIDNSIKKAFNEKRNFNESQFATF